jgi:V/A-type H+/Na+-transporting ATPase subunit E
MQTKLQELTEKIYQEGVNKANEEAEKILSDAKKEAKTIISAAKKDAENLLSQTRKEADEAKKNALNELQLSGRQAISDIKQKLVALVEAKTIQPETKKAFEEKDFVPGLINTIVKNWNPESSDSVNLKVVLPKEKQKELESFFTNKTGNLLNKGLEVSFNEKIKGGFKIGPKDGGYLVSFADEDFEHFFQAYLRPKLIELLFARKEE